MLIESNDMNQFTMKIKLHTFRLNCSTTTKKIKFPANFAIETKSVDLFGDNDDLVCAKISAE